MRIRKRQAVVLEPPRPTRLLSAVNSGNENEHFVGQNSCTCCSRQRRLQNWEFRNEFDRETDEPVNRFAGGISFIDKNQITDGEEKESLVAATLGNLASFDRVRNNDHNIKATGSRVPLFVSGQFCGSGDVNHPGNKPKESLLYSLYCVFSKLSGKAVLTAREALSRIIEERLPGLDEETGLPSLQVSKVMRSNPYFVHLEGGKFFLCSAPSFENKEDAESEDVLDSEWTPRSASPSLQPTVGLLNSLNKAESSKDERQPLSHAEVQRTVRARSKAVATIDNGAVNGRSRSSKREGQKALKPQNSLPDHGKNGADQPVEPICKRYDGRGWKCNEKALPGYSMCRHHHELIVNRLARLRSSGRLVSKKSSKRRKASAKPLKEGAAAINEGEVSLHNEQSGTHWWKNVKARSLKSINN